MSTETPGSTERRIKEQSLRLLQRMQAKLTLAEGRMSAPIAIVGMACRFPLGDTPDSIWAQLKAGREGVTTVPAERWATGRGAVVHGGFLSRVDRFDAEFFGISPREAVATDPQQRLILEVAWEALEHAGIAADRLENTRAGVYLGCCTADYARLGGVDAQSADGYAATGGAPGVAAGRIAYTLGLNGPALVVDTACSSSLVSVHLAVQALRAGECELALSGGVNLTLLPQGAATLDRLHMLSPDGQCKAFDASANGFVRGEGCGVLVLKRLLDAEAAGDRVLAVIRGTAVNQDGRSAGLTAPNGPAQEAVIRTALANAGLTPDGIDAIEAHGTGTSLGDPIEMHALASVFAGRSKPLAVGSVKTNIGHAEAAAGVAGLIKAVLMLQHQTVPASLHFKQLNPHIDLAGVPLQIPTVTRSRPDASHIGVSSFGFSGTNAHVIVERAPELRNRPPSPVHPPRLLISASSPEALSILIDRYRALLAQGAPFADLAHSAAVGRARLPWWVCDDRPEQLATAIARPSRPPTCRPSTCRPLPAAASGCRSTLSSGSAIGSTTASRWPGRPIAQAGIAPVFEIRILPGSPRVADHRVRGEPILPAADMLERLRAAAETTGKGSALVDVTFDRHRSKSPRRARCRSSPAHRSPSSPATAIPGNATPARRPRRPHRRSASISPSCAASAASRWIRRPMPRGCAIPVWSTARSTIVSTTLFRGPTRALARLRPAPYVALLGCGVSHCRRDSFRCQRRGAPARRYRPLRSRYAAWLRSAISGRMPRSSRKTRASASSMSG